MFVATMRISIAMLIGLAPATTAARSPSHWLEPPPANSWFKLAYTPCPTRSENGQPAKPGKCYDATQLIGLTQTGYIYMRDEYLECPFNGAGAVRRAVLTTLTAYTQLECRTDGSTITLTETNTQKYVYPWESEPTLRKSIVVIELKISSSACDLLNFSHVNRSLIPERYVTNKGERYKAPAEESTYRAALKSNRGSTVFRSYKEADEAPD